MKSIIIRILAGILIIMTLFITACDSTECKHTWKDATCTFPKTCSICNITEGEALGHTWIDSPCTTPGTCSICNETENEALGHSWIDATCTTPKTCSKCNETEGSALGHLEQVAGKCPKCGYNLSIDMKTVVGKPIDDILGFSYYQNSADGIKLCWQAKNISDKTINYYTVTIYFYNSVGDPAYSEITGKSFKSLKYVGPIKPNQELVIFDIVDYIPACSKVMIGEIELEYSDGTSDYGWYGYYTTYENYRIN